MQRNKAGSIGPKLSAIFMSGIMLLSFSFKKGGDSFEIYLNNKLIVQQYVSQSGDVKSIQLDKSNSNARMDIYYSHCGETGKSRYIIIKDDKNNVIKEWRFADATGESRSMVCQVKDILNLQKANGVNRLYLYYYSKQLPAGRLLASVILPNDNKTIAAAKLNVRK